VADTTDTTTAPIQYTGQDDAIIAFGTDVWLLDARGADVDAAAALQEHAAPAGNTCDGCRDCPVVGAIAMEHGIERCDLCETFSSDFDAAEAVAKLVAPTGESYTLWFHPNQPIDTTS